MSQVTDYTVASLSESSLWFLQALLAFPDRRLQFLSFCLVFSRNRGRGGKLHCRRCWSVYSNLSVFRLHSASYSCLTSY